MYAPLKDLIAHIGVDCTEKLIGAYGGNRIYIPLVDTITPTHELAVTIGVEAARRLAGLWAQEYVEIPNGWRRARAVAREALLRDREHMTIRELVRKYNITRRRVMKILADGPLPAAKQRSLF